MPAKEKRRNKAPDLFRIKYVHFVGIGGVGMSAIAKILIKKGYIVSGSDLKESPNTIRLRDLGAKIFIGHDAANVRGSQLVVVSSAVSAGNPEIDAASASGIPVMKRAEMLSWIMDQFPQRIAVAGTHGKTTTTSMISTVLSRCGKDPTFLIGGEANDVDGNARLGTGPHVVAEADESDGSFLLLHPTIEVITNIESDHMEYYGTFKRVSEAFSRFAALVPEGGLLVLGGNGRGTEEVKKNLAGKKIVTYGLSKESEYWADNFKFSERRSKFDVYRGGNHLGEVTLCVPGMQNIDNALAAIAVSDFLGLDQSCVFSGLQFFTGAKRRFQIIGDVNDILIVDDYGHHPTEVARTLEAARLGYPGRRIVCVFQPHRYTRTQHLYEQFGKAFVSADKVMITDIYSAGEQKIEGISGRTIYDEVKKNSSDVTYIQKRQAVADDIIQAVRPKDLLLIMGAGDITNLGKEIYNRLKENG